MNRIRLTSACCLLLFGLLLFHAKSSAQPSQNAAPPLNDILDVSPIRDLLHLIDTIIRENPDYEKTLSGLAALDQSAREDSLARLVAANASNPRISSEVEALISSPAYQLYYKQFSRSANPDWHRKFFASLPYYATDGPGGVGFTLLELCRHRREIAGWYDNVISQVDLERCLSISRDWLPPGEYDVPQTYFIFDGMGDAFANDGKVCVDLYGVLLTKRPSATRFAGLSEIGTDRIERVLAHEFHHVYSDPLIYPESQDSLPWQKRWKDDIIRGLVSEGTAMQCDPREGFEREVRRDSAVIHFWINELNRTLALIDSGRITESQVEAWRRNDSKRAKALLMEFLKKRYPDGNQDSLLACHMPTRPNLSHTLGWWMVSHIVESTKQRDKAIQLLFYPDSLYRWYNDAVGESDSTLQMTAGL